MPSKYDRFPITGTWITEAKSGKAFLFQLDNEDGSTSTIKKWLPHSQSKMEGGEKVTDHAGTMSITIPLWLAETEGIYELYRDRLMNEEYGEEPEGEQLELGEGRDSKDLGWV